MALWYRKSTESEVYYRKVRNKFVNMAKKKITFQTKGISVALQELLLLRSPGFHGDLFLKPWFSQVGKACFMSHRITQMLQILQIGPVLPALLGTVPVNAIPGGISPWAWGWGGQSMVSYYTTAVPWTKACWTLLPIPCPPLKIVKCLVRAGVKSAHHIMATTSGTHCFLLSCITGVWASLSEVAVRLRGFHRLSGSWLFELGSYSIVFPTWQLSGRNRWMVISWKSLCPALK